MKRWWWEKEQVLPAVSRIGLTWCTCAVQHKKVTWAHSREHHFGPPCATQCVHCFFFSPFLFSVLWKWGFLYHNWHPCYYSNLAMFTGHLLIFFFVKNANKSIYVMENNIHQAQSVPVFVAFGFCLQLCKMFFFFFLMQKHHKWQKQESKTFSQLVNWMISLWCPYLLIRQCQSWSCWLHFI